MGVTRRSNRLLVFPFLVMAMAGCSGSAAQRTDGAFNVVATVDEVMEGIVIPSSQAIFDAVVYSNGELVQAPKSDEDWTLLRVRALALAESGNLLLMPPRAKDAGDWAKFSRAMTDASVGVAAAAGAKDLERVLQGGSEIYAACTACHAKYVPEE